VERFVREAQAPAELHHPNIVAVFEVGQEGELVYIVSEFIAGQSLEKWLETQRRRLTDRKVAKLCVTIAEALDYAHGHRVVHRDLKPSNIMMDCSGQRRLMDFGLAKRAAGEITMPPAKPREEKAADILDKKAPQPTAGKAIAPLAP
jgi:serine/threonine-protein kinase